MPTLGLVQVGGQAMADRYTYLPQVGLLIVLVWGAADLAPKGPRRGALLTAATLAVAAAWSALSWAQTAAWRDTFALAEAALAATGRNPVALDLADAAAAPLAARGEWVALAEAYSRLAALRPEEPRLQERLGAALSDGGRPDLALTPLENALRLRPGDRGTADELATALARVAAALHAQGDAGAALAAMRRAAALRPADADLACNLGVLLEAAGRRDEARGAYDAALRLQPNHARARTRREVLASDEPRS